MKDRRRTMRKLLCSYFLNKPDGDPALQIRKFAVSSLEEDE